MQQTTLPENFREMVREHFTLLQPRTKKHDALLLNVSGYSDVAHLMSDLVKVCMLALESEGGHDRIPSPEVNISGVLSVVLDLVPFEEFELLDKIRQQALNPPAPEEPDWRFIRESLRITPEVYWGECERE